MLDRDDDDRMADEQKVAGGCPAGTDRSACCLERGHSGDCDYRPIHEFPAELIERGFASVMVDDEWAEGPELLRLFAARAAEVGRPDIAIVYAALLCAKYMDWVSEDLAEVAFALRRDRGRVG